MVGATLERERGGDMSGERLEVAYGLAALGEQRKTAIPEVVEADRWENGQLKQRLEVPVYSVLSIEEAASPVGEHEPVILPF